MDWKNQTTTPNASARYVYFNFNTTDRSWWTFRRRSRRDCSGRYSMHGSTVGPEGEDKGKGGKYLLLPPEFKGNPPAGYIVVRLHTYNGYILLRAIPKGSSEVDVSNAIALVKNCASI